MRVAVLRPAHADPEAAAACRWVERQGWELVVIGPDVAQLPEGIDSVWCHAGSGIPELAPDGEARLAAYVRQGGHVVLSLLAAPLGVRLGGAGDPPSLVEVQRPWHHVDDPQWPAAFRDWPGYPHIRGFQGWGTHPLFRQLGTGTFSWTATEGEPVSRAVYRRPAWPAGRAVAVDRSYVHLDADTVVAWEYEVGAGRLMCLGANVALGARDGTLAPHRDVVLANALRPSDDMPRTGWPPAEKRHAPVAPIPRPRGLAASGPVPAIDGITHVPPGGAPVTLGAARGLIVGSMSDGVREVWLHPLCVLDGGLRVECDPPVVATASSASSVHVERTLSSSGVPAFREVAFLHTSAPEFVYVLTPLDVERGARGGVEFRVGLRRQWPFPPDALAPVRVEHREAGRRHVVQVTGRDGAHVAICYADGAEAVSIVADDAAPVIRIVATAGESLRFVLRASSSGATDLALTTHDAWDALRAREHDLAGFESRSTRLVTSEEALQQGWTHAVQRLGNFIVAAPGGGRALMAGYAGTRPGWNVSRPGYAWFFGRDACWTIDALLALGAFDEARDAITFLARTMDVTGKVIHEYTTSGVAHFDAADSTPLFLRAVGLYGAWTGDLATIAGWWPAVARAVTFVRSCDRDGDGLPENTGVGHGWIEMGVLGGGAVTSYVAAIWIDALRRLIPMAGHLADEDMARQLTDALRQAEVGLASLRGPDGVLALHRDATGRLSPDRTAMDTVPIALGVGASSSDHALLADLASPRFSAPWGLRMLPVDDPRYDPVAYHAGSAWPLFTGWAALADCAMGAPARGLARVRSMARAAMAGGTGGFAEVLHGDTGARAGVCPDQAWSAAMVISPIVHGFAGLEPDAPHRRAALRLRHPDTNDPLRLQGLRVGETRFDLEWTPTPAGCAVVATHREGPALVLHMDGLAGPGEICDAGHPVHVTVKPDRVVGGEAR